MTSSIQTISDAVRLEPRREPQQARSRERIEQILDATGELLAESGVDGLSTRLIAARAKVNVATIYQFFPNKYAVIRALFERTMDQLVERHSEVTRHLDLVALPTREEHEKVMERFAEVVLEIPGLFPLRRAVHALPELAEARALEERARRIIGERIVRRFSRFNPNLSSRQSEIMSEIMIETTMSLLEYSTRVSPNERASVLAEIRTMLMSYLLHYFGPRNASSAPEASSS